MKLLSTNVRNWKWMFRGLRILPAKQSQPGGKQAEAAAVSLLCSGIKLIQPTVPVP